MNEPIEMKGYWWLPDNKDNTVVGMLKYTPNAKIELELIGSFYTNQSPISTLTSQHEENVIHGISSDGKEITLFNNFCSGSYNFSVQFPILKYSCTYLLIGIHLDQFEKKQFYKANIEIPLLSEWCPPQAISLSMSQIKEPENFEKTTISYINKSIISDIRIDSNTTIQLVGCVDSQFYRQFKSTIKEYTLLKIIKEEDSCLSDFCKVIFLFEQFISFATLETVACSKILLFDRNNYQECGNGEKCDKPIQLIYTLGCPHTENHKRKSSFLFDFKSIKDKYPEIIKKWYKESDHIAPIRQHLIESIKTNQIFTSANFLVVIQAIDGFCSRFRKYKSKETFRNKLKLIIAEFSSIDKIANEKFDVQTIINCRNYYSHFYLPDDRHVVDGLELYDITHQLRKLLVCCVLHYIGFNYPEINTILNKSNSSLLKKVDENYWL